jgi:hypothetical protein
MTKDEYLTNVVAELGYEKLSKLNYDLCVFSNHIAANTAILSIVIQKILNFF